jgi:hypothetical protein
MSQPIESQPRRPIHAKQRTSHARLRLVPPPDPSIQQPLAQIWHGDADLMSPAYTTIDDWPTERDFTPFVKAAFASGNARLVEQLRRDREYCLVMRRKLRREAMKNGPKA